MSPRHSGSPGSRRLGCNVTPTRDVSHTGHPMSVSASGDRILVADPAQNGASMAAPDENDPPYFRGHGVRAITVQTGELLLGIKRGREATMTQYTVREASELRRAMADCSLRNEISDALLVCAEWQRSQPATRRTH